MEGVEGQAEDSCPYSTVTGTSPAPVRSCHMGHHQSCSSQVEPFVSFMMVFINVPFGGGPFFGIHCDEGTRLETGKVELGSRAPRLART